MRAAVSRAAGTLEIEDVWVDEPRGREVLVRTAAVGVCHSDRHFFQGTITGPHPTIHGHEASGVVVALGDQVVGLSVGDNVVVSLSVSCGSCTFCWTGRPFLCSARESTRRAPAESPRLRDGRGTTLEQFVDVSAFAELMLVHERAVVAIPSDVPMDSAAMLGCAVVTGLGAVFNTAGVRPGDRVAVVGCGGVGLNVVQGARIAGASQIIAIDLMPDNLEVARRLGATHVVEAGAQDPLGEVLAASGGGVDHSFEAVGRADTCVLAFRMLRPDGTATVVGLLPSGTRIPVPAEDLLRGKRIQGSVMGSTRLPVDIGRYLDLLASGRLILDGSSCPRIGLDDLGQVLSDGPPASATRTLLDFS